MGGEFHLFFLMQPMSSVTLIRGLWNASWWNFISSGWYDGSDLFWPFTWTHGLYIPDTALYNAHVNTDYARITTKHDLNLNEFHRQVLRNIMLDIINLSSKLAHCVIYFDFSLHPRMTWSPWRSSTPMVLSVEILGSEWGKENFLYLNDPFLKNSVVSEGWSERIGGICAELPYSMRYLASWGWDPFLCRHKKVPKSLRIRNICNENKSKLYWD